MSQLGPYPESKILGTHVFQNALFTEESEKPVNVLTGDTPEYARKGVEEAKAFADSLSTDKPYIAKPASVESQVETQSGPYTGCVFHHFSIVGGMDMHKSFSEAWDNPAYNVEVDPDYETGTLTITVTKK